MSPSSRRITAIVSVSAAAVVAALLGAYFLLPSLFGPSVQPSPSATGPLVIGLSLASNQETRWAVEAEAMEAEAERLGATLLTAVADGDADAQLQQSRELLAKGVRVLIVVPQDSEKAAEIVSAAHKSGAKVVAYDRLIRNAPVDYYLSFDNTKVGEVQARGVLDAIGGSGRIAYVGGSPTDNNAALVREGSMRILTPKIESGDVEIVFDEQIPDWNAELAYQAMADYLRGGGRLNGAVVANDGMAGGVIRALRERGLAGKVPVSGQDAELRACRDLVAGTQTLTVYKPLRELAEEAVRLAVADMTGQQVRINATVDNGSVPVPSRLLDVIKVTKENLDTTVILDGLYSAEEIYR